MEKNILNCMFWIRNNEKYLIEMYEGKYILIKNKKVVDVSDSKDEITLKAIKKFGIGKFLVYFVKNDLMINDIVEDNNSLVGDLKKYI